MWTAQKGFEIKIQKEKKKNTRTMDGLLEKE